MLTCVVYFNFHCTVHMLYILYVMSFLAKYSFVVLLQYHVHFNTRWRWLLRLLFRDLLCVNACLRWHLLVAGLNCWSGGHSHFWSESQKLSADFVMMRVLSVIYRNTTPKNFRNCARSPVAFFAFVDFVCCYLVAKNCFNILDLLFSTSNFGW